MWGEVLKIVMEACSMLMSSRVDVGKDLFQLSPPGPNWFRAGLEGVFRNLQSRMGRGIVCVVGGADVAAVAEWASASGARLALARLANFPEPSFPNCFRNN